MGAPDCLVLVEPSLEYADAFRAMAEETTAAGEHLYAVNMAAFQAEFPAILNRIISRAFGENAPPGWVPGHEYWLMHGDSGIILGAIRLRHGLTLRLERYDGQIGYNIRPSARNQGYATRMLQMLLAKMKAQGWQRVLITCNTNNLASARVIEKNGGRLENQVVEEHTGRLISRYWIEIQPND